ncbi:DUF6939 family protein [Saccharothrix sp. BKS2]|uniref:DUF6939 family protein n=1 Tax=Saccharothrix sp. BKS2 TaxID=3064400 RepID=UPI0039EC64FD
MPSPVCSGRTCPSRTVCPEPDLPEPWVRLSPSYPHGGIPVPFTPGVNPICRTARPGSGLDWCGGNGIGLRAG